MSDAPEETRVEPSESVVSPSDRPSDAERRAALVAMGQYAAYTAPALLALLIGTKAHAVS
ncbi:MAG: hypothetical protein SF182_20360 [Deltaproteobacteria bacterium]|nr:hypothetical protein [Deltaproteobacteria bacterium]